MNRKVALTVTLAAGMAFAPVAADAAFLSLTGGTSFNTPSGNDVLGAGATLFANAKLSTTEDNVKLTFYDLGSESGARNTLNIGGPGGRTHTEVDNPPYSASWSGSLIGSVTQASAGFVDMSFTSSRFSGQLRPGLGDTSKNIAFAYLADTSGAKSNTSTNVVLFALDDGGSNAGKRGSTPDDDYDDHVGYVVAESLTSASAPEAPLMPTPIPAALPVFVTAMVGLGLMGRRRKAAA